MVLNSPSIDLLSSSSGDESDSLQVAEALTESEAEELQDAEATIEMGIRAFWEMGQALKLIRDRRLYRSTHKTFEEYCLERWDLARNYADKLIVAAAVMENLRTIVRISPANEAQVRPLVPLPPEQQRLAWARAEELAVDGKMTAARVAAAVREIRPKQPQRKSSVPKNEIPIDPNPPIYKAGDWVELLTPPPESGWNPGDLAEIEEVFHQTEEVLLKIDHCQFGKKFSHFRYADIRKTTLCAPELPTNNESPARGLSWHRDNIYSAVEEMGAVEVVRWCLDLVSHEEYRQIQELIAANKTQTRELSVA